MANDLDKHNDAQGFWARKFFQEIGDECKLRETQLKAVQVIDPDFHFAIRVDGRAFHTFTKSMVKPFDYGFREAMIAATKVVMLQLKPAFAYVQSDEITYVFRGKGDANYQHIFGGKVDKILSVVASLTSVAFYVEADARHLVYPGELPHFDARLAEMSYDCETMQRLVMWRENDAMRNSVAMVAQSKFSQRVLSGLNIKQQLDKLADECGLDWFTEVLPSDQRGTYIASIPRTMELSHEDRMKIPEHRRPDPGATFTRSVMETHHFTNWDMDTRLNVLWHKRPMDDDNG